MELFSNVKNVRPLAKQIFLTAAVFVPLSILTSEAVFASEWYSDIELVSIRAFDNQDGHFVKVNGFPSGVCPNSSLVVIQKEDDSEWKLVHANILAAGLADKKVLLRIDGCQGEFPKVDGVEVYF